MLGVRKMCLEEANQRLKQVFSFLDDLNSRLNPAVVRIADQPWAFWLDELPDHPSIIRSLPRALPATETETRDGEPRQAEPSLVVLTVVRPNVTRPPDPPVTIREWLRAGWDDPNQEVGFHDYLNIGADNNPVVRFQDDVLRPQSLAHWKEVRHQWHKAELITRAAIKVYEKLFDVHGRLERENEKLELMLRDGVLSWTQESNSIFHPVLLQRVLLAFDTNVPAFTISYAETSPEFYSGALQAIPDAGPHIQGLATEVDEANLHPLAIEADGFLESLVQRLDGHGIFLGNQKPLSESLSPTIGRAPVLYLRSRTLGYSRAIKDTLKRISTSQEFGPGLLSIIGCHPQPEVSEAEPTPRDHWRSEIGHPDVLFGKPFNLEQVQIAERLERHKAVLVQGPPGTGKSHTIANLIGHLLAQNKSILVTSHTSKALRVLRDQVVEPLRPLCVSVLDRDAQSRNELKESVETIQHRLPGADLNTLEREAAQFTNQRKRLLETIAKRQEELFQVRSGEFRNIVVNGEPISPSEAARFVAKGVDQDDWIPGPIPLDAPIPLQPCELVELYALNPDTTTEDDEHVSHELHDPLQLMQPRDFQSAVNAAQQLTNPLSRRDAELWASLRFAPGTPQVIKCSFDAFSELRAEFSHFSDWRCAAIDASVGQPVDREVWDHLLAKIDEVTQLVAASRLIRLQFNPAVHSTGDLPRQVAIADEIVNYLGKGGQIGWVVLTVNRAWKRAIQGWQVTGGAPSHIDHFKSIHAHLSIIQLRAELAILWDGLLANHGEPTFEEFGAEPEHVCDQFRAEVQRILNWWSQQVAPNMEKLKQVGFQWETMLGRRPSTSEPTGKSKRFFAAVGADLLPHLQQLATRLQLSAHRDRIAQQGKLLQGSTIPCIRALHDATVSHDTVQYQGALQELTRMLRNRPRAVRRRQLLSQLEKTAPTWAAGIRQRAGIHGSVVVPGDAIRAWKWRQLSDELLRLQGLDGDSLSNEVEQLKVRLAGVTIQAIDRKTWAGLKRRVTQDQQQALVGWADTMRRLGAGYVRRAPELLAQARDCMKKCRQSVPVWIVPISRLPECFDFSVTQFDVVIIDEASQCDLMGLLALTLAKQVIIVGDHEQVSPSAVGINASVFTDLIREHLDGIPNRELYDGRLSVYHLARQSFGGMVCLREHFRCVPEIIAFSNFLCYQGRIQALRDSTSSQLAPSIVPIRVESSSRDENVNEHEAMSVASLLIAAVRHLAYEGQSFGVISLLGDDQAFRIDEILQRNLSPEEYLSRRIICGNAAQFQGDERDVIFLSMVAVPHEGPLPRQQRDDAKQRMNVAASRARNQLWVVHSLDRERDLQPNDLRRLLLDHAYDPQAVSRAHQAVVGKTESEFERQVVERLVAARYHVVPQWKVGAFRIDIVVEGAGRRLAVECDGDRFHPIEQIPEDMARQAMLERLGWQFYRLRGSSYFRDPDGAMAKLFAKLSSMQIHPQTEPKLECAGSSEVVEDVKRIAYSLRQEWIAAATLPTETNSVINSDTVNPPEIQTTSDDEMGVPAAWQLTLAEWRTLCRQFRDAGNQEALTRIGGRNGHDFAHKVQVKQAIGRGDSVPDCVLRDYPDLVGGN